MNRERIGRNMFPDDIQPALPRRKVDCDSQLVRSLGSLRYLTEKVIHDLLMPVPRSMNHWRIRVHRVRVNLGAPLDQQLANRQLPLRGGELQSGKISEVRVGKPGMHESGIAVQKPLDCVDVAFDDARENCLDTHGFDHELRRARMATTFPGTRDEGSSATGHGSPSCPSEKRSSKSPVFNDPSN